jgi:hypothetical protein
MIIQGGDGRCDDNGPWWGPVPRSFGQIDGRVDALYPFLYIARRGARHWEMQRRRDPDRDGMFSISKGMGNGSAEPYVGAILPVASCRDPAMREGLMKAVGKLAGPHEAGFRIRRQDVEAVIQEGGLPASIVGYTLFSGFVELTSLRLLFPLLHDRFDRVTALLDDPKGAAEIVATAPLPWSRYFEFLEWYYGLEEGMVTLTGFELWLVYAGATRLGGGFGNRNDRREQLTPGQRPDRFFTIRPEVTDATLRIDLILSSRCWAWLTVALDDQELVIHCSDMFPPFQPLIGWLRRLDAGDLPAAFEIDEEGKIKRLVALPTEHPERLLFMIERWNMEVFLQGIVDRRALIDGFRRALWVFFSERFDPKLWREDLGDGIANEEAPRIILADPLFDALRGGPAAEAL